MRERGWKREVEVYRLKVCEQTGDIIINKYYKRLCSEPAENVLLTDVMRTTGTGTIKRHRRESDMKL